MIFTVSKTILLLSLSVSNIWASSSSAVTEIEPDYKIQFKVPGDLPDERMDLYGGVKKVKSDTKNKNRMRDPILNYLNEIGGPLKILCNMAIENLNSELKYLNSLYQFLFIHFDKGSHLSSGIYNESFDFLKNYVQVVIAEEKQEWEIRKSILYNLEIKSNLSYGNTSELENFKTAATKWLENPALKNCEEKTINLAFSNNQQQLIQNDIKMWLLAKQMIDGPDSAGNRVRSEYIRPDWKLLVDKLNVPEDRFKLYQISKELNLHYLMNDLSLSFEKSVEKMKLELDKMEKKSIGDNVSSAVKEEFALRRSVFNVVLNNQDLRLETVKMTLKIIERFVQGLIRYEQLNLHHVKTILNHNFTKNELVIVKFWLMSLQMFTENGWQSSKYGLKTYPEPEPQPKLKVSSEAAEIPEIQESESSTNVAPTKNSIFGGFKKMITSNVFGKKPEKK